MHFGEYELSPSLISLSPLPSAHPEAFQRLLVRSSSWCYPAFNLAKGRSLGFASATADYTPCSDSLSLRIRVSSHLTLPAKATRRFIMQKARRLSAHRSHGAKASKGGLTPLGRPAYQHRQSKGMSVLWIFFHKLCNIKTRHLFQYLSGFCC